MSIESLRDKIRMAEWRRDNCRRKALACETYDAARAAMFDEFADTAEKEADELRRELRDAEDDEGADLRPLHRALLQRARRGGRRVPVCHAAPV